MLRKLRRMARAARRLAGGGIALKAVPQAPEPRPTLRLDTERTREVYGLDGLPLAPSLDAFVAGVESGQGGELRFVHAPTTHVSAVAGGLIPGHNYFGSETSPLFESYRRNGNVAQARRTAVYLVENAVFAPRLMTAFAVEGGFYGPLTDDWDANVLDALGRYDPLYAIGPGKSFRVRAEHATVPVSERTAIMLCGRGFDNYGHFMTDGLPLIFLLRQCYPGLPLALVGRRLHDYQREIMGLLSLADSVVEVSEPTAFRRMVVLSLSALHAPYPTRFLRPLCDTLRYRYSGPIETRERKIFVSRGGAFALRRFMTNRAEVEATVRALGFEVVYPETMSIAEQIGLFAAARIVIGESGAASINMAFCDPGTPYLEIKSESFPDGFGRGIASMFGIDWSMLSGRAVASEVGQRAYEVDLDVLRTAIRTLSARAR